MLAPRWTTYHSKFSSSFIFSYHIHGGHCALRLPLPHYHCHTFASLLYLTQHCFLHHSVATITPSYPHPQPLSLLCCQDYSPQLLVLFSFSLTYKCILCICIILLFVLFSFFIFALSMYPLSIVFLFVFVVLVHCHCVLSCLLGKSFLSNHLFDHFISHMRMSSVGFF